MSVSSRQMSACLGIEKKTTNLNNTFLFLSRFELHEWHILGAETLIADPLGIDLLGQKKEGVLRQTCAGPVEPEVAARLTQDGLVILMHLLVADTTGIDGRGRGVLWVNHHGLVRRVDLLV